MNTKSLTKSQKIALLNIKMGNNVFLTGVAGTGKTFLLNELASLTGKRVYLTASTGSASLLLNNGRTISSFLGLGKYDDDTANFYCRAGLLDNSIIVIDEISMIGKAQWNFIMKSIKKNSYDFRTVQIVISGDPAQMPPMHWDEPLYEEIKDFKTIELKEIVRQKDKTFIKHLMGIRNSGIIKKHHNFLLKKSGNLSKQGITLVKDRKTMNILNSQVKKGKIKISVDLTHVPENERPYDMLEIWEGMRVIITKNNYREGYVNGDIGTVIEIKYNLYVTVKLDRNDEIVEVYKFSDSYKENNKIIIKEKKLDKFYDEEEDEFVENYKFISENGEEVFVSKKHFFSHKINQTFIYSEDFSYEYMPLLPAYFLSVRRSQGNTFQKGIIHRSILGADVPTQYTALSRFVSVENINYPQVNLHKI
jgi:ATP-dependent exoDNAse (exonuclease V) alpha subunit